MLRELPFFAALLLDPGASPGARDARERLDGEDGHHHGCKRYTSDQENGCVGGLEPVPAAPPDETLEGQCARGEQHG